MTEIRMVGATASNYPIGTIVRADREQGTPRLLVVRIDPDGTPVGVPTKKREKKPPLPSSEFLAAEAARLARQAAENPGPYPYTGPTDHGSLRDMDW